MLKAIIVDDEQHCIDSLEILLNLHKRNVSLIGSYTNISDAKKAIESTEVDVLFLDVHLRRETGFDLLKQLKSINFEIVFTTAYDHYAVEAFKFSAIDYLLKPIDSDSFSRAIEKLKEKKSFLEISKKIDTLFHNLEEKNEHLKKITVPTSEGLTLIKVSDIIRCQSDVNYTHIFLHSGGKVTVAKTLKHFENLLEEHHFFRTHHSHLVNLSFVDKYLKGKGGYALMSDGTHVEVAVRRKEAFLKKLSGN